LGEVTRQGDRLLMTNRPHAPGSTLPTPAAPRAAAFADEDFEWVSTVTELEPGKAMPAYSLTASLTIHGLRSERRMDPSPDDMPGPVAPLDPALLRSLPGDTLVAFARRCTALDIDVASWLAAATAGLAASAEPRQASAGTAASEDGEQTTARVELSATGPKTSVDLDARTKQQVETMRQTLAAFGIPEHLTLDGDLLVYARAAGTGEPYPSLTVAASMAEAQARRLIAAAARLLAAKVDAEGATSGRFFGLVAITADYRDGVFVITTDPEGTATHRGRAGGFDASAEVAASLSAIPADAYGACVANGPVAWSTVARLAASLKQGDPATSGRLAALADDLAAACHGHPEYMYTTADARGRRSVSEGPLFGLIGLIMDTGMGALPLKSLWN
jgi:hypothetical protein